jgi:hypothetical protein
MKGRLRGQWLGSVRAVHAYNWLGMGWIRECYPDDVTSIRTE